jgi:hypothetical protein
VQANIKECKKSEVLAVYLREAPLAWLAVVIPAGWDHAERHLAGFWTTKSPTRRAVLAAAGDGMTRHHRMGAAEQPSGALWEPSGNQ